MSDLPIHHTWKDSERLVPRVFVQLLQRIAQHPSAGATVMLVAALTALVVANTPLSSWYEEFWATPVAFSVGDFDSLSGMDLRHWVNDGLMTLFFVLVSLEIKRELVSGHLREWRAAVMPVIAAVGGMVVPAALFLTSNWGDAGERGWGIPMATDVVFAVALITVFGRKVPTSLRVFLLTLAVVDDLGAIMVIAIFYTGNVEVLWLLAALGTVVMAVLFRSIRIRAVLLFIVLGVICWYALLRGGVHPTIAGVMFGLLVPAWPSYDPRHFAEHASSVIRAFTRMSHNDVLTSGQSSATQRALRNLKRLATETESPLRRAEHVLAPWVTFGIVPIFAFANAGVTIDFSALANIAAHPVTIGIVVGLVVGKPLGIAGTLAVVRLLGIPSKPPDASWGQVVAVAFCGGIGFTVALFVGELAYSSGHLADPAKIGILLGSTTAAIVGAVLLRLVPGKAHPAPAPSDTIKPARDRKTTV